MNITLIIIIIIAAATVGLSLSKKKLNISSSLPLSDILKAVMISFATALFTQLLTYYFWTKQFENNTQQKILDYKITSFDKFSFAAHKAVHLSNSAFRIKIEQYIEERKWSDSILKATGILHNTIPADLNYSIHEKLRNNQPLLYENYMKLLEFQSEYNSSAGNAGLFFKNVITQINQLTVSLFDEGELRKNITDNLRRNNKHLYELDKDQVVDNLCKNEASLVNTILNEMADEIKKE